MPEENLAGRIQAAAAGGHDLDAGARRRLERGLGADLSGVQVHADDEADQLTQSVEALAFTTGRDMYFRAGFYQPGTPEGLELLAHEATHTMQQAAGPVAGVPAPGGVALSTPGDPFERAAERAAHNMTARQQPEDLPVGGPPVPTARVAPPADLSVPAFELQRQSAPPSRSSSTNLLRVIQSQRAASPPPLPCPPSRRRTIRPARSCNRLIQR